MSMNTASAVGVYQGPPPKVPGQSRKYGVWIQANIMVGDREVPIDVKGKLIFDTPEQANARAWEVLASLGQYEGLEYLPWGDF